MRRFKVGVTLVVTTWALIQNIEASSPSIDLLFSLRANADNQTTTPSSSISQRIHASLNNVLRLPPLPLLGGPRPEGQTHDIIQRPSQLRQQLRQHISGAFGQPSNGAQPAPPSFLPNVNQAIHTTIAQLSTLSHWPFGYVTTVRPQAQSTARPVEPPPPSPSTTPRTTQAPTTPVQIRTQKPPTTRPPASSPPPLPLILPPPPPSPPQSSPIFQAPLPQQPSPTARPSLPNRIHNRIHSTLNYIRLPSLSQIGNPRPRPMLTEPPWVTELLGPTLEPPTTRAPTIGERINTAVTNVILFVPATLLNFWYQNWGTRHVDRVIQRLQLSTPKPGSPAEPIFATISNQANNNVLANLTSELGAPAMNDNSTGLPAIAAFINSNGTLKPTIVHPVLNMTSNTIEYHLRSENETTVLWTGSLSNDIFFGNKKPLTSEIQGVEDDEYEPIKQSILTIKLK